MYICIYVYTYRGVTVRLTGKFWKSISMNSRNRVRGRLSIYMYVHAYKCTCMYMQGITVKLTGKFWKSRSWAFECVVDMYSAEMPGFKVHTHEHTHTHARTRTHTLSLSLTHRHTHTLTHTHTHAHAHTHTHTHTLANTWSRFEPYRTILFPFNVSTHALRLSLSKSYNCP